MDTTVSVSNSLDRMIEVHNRVRILPGYQEPPQASGEFEEVSNYILGEAQRFLDESPTRRSDRIAEKKKKEIIGQIDKIAEYYLEAEKNIQARQVTQIEMVPAEKDKIA